jgi:hypothetical protein
VSTGHPDILIQVLLYDRKEDFLLTSGRGSGEEMENLSVPKVACLVQGSGQLKAREENK